MTILGLLRRPSLLASLAVHGGVVALAAGSVPAVASRSPEPVALGARFEPDVALAEAPLVDDVAPEDVARDDLPALVEPVLVEPPPEAATEPLEPSTERPVDAAPPRFAAPTRAALGFAASARRAGIGAPAAAAPAESGPARRGGGFVPASPLPGNARPAYPPASLARGAEGDVWLLVRVGPAGAVDDVKVERTSGHDDLDVAAVRAVASWRFEPAVADGSAIAETVRVPLRFRLR